ncbi:FtsJ-domain-containing protein [Lipomyces arxii]|uniref:FtsJ-domain-containing protein n=1 Tax=Lipomyces arxii TaxID=56418 RepID=UPI0034CFAC75
MKVLGVSRLWSAICRHPIKMASLLAELIQPTGLRYASSASSKRWLGRQSKDAFSREARIQGLRSRAAFKLLELDHDSHIFASGQTVVDLGFAPGSWTQVAVDRTRPGGRVLGIDILPCIPPKGASAIQGNFLSVETHKMVKEYLRDTDRGRPVDRSLVDASNGEPISYIDMERHERPPGSDDDQVQTSDAETETKPGLEPMVDVVLSDMSEPWPHEFAFWSRTLSQPYIRLMNTSGVPIRDHGVSMDLCHAALAFSLDTLKTGGHFICKYYMGSEDKFLEKCLRKAFATVKREKPEASRKFSREQYFVAKFRKKNVTKQDVYGDMYDC